VNSEIWNHSLKESVGSVGKIMSALLTSVCIS